MGFNSGFKGLIWTIKEYTDWSDRPKIEFGDRLLRIQNRSLGCQKRLAVTRLTEWLVAAQEYLWFKYRVMRYSTKANIHPFILHLPQQVSDKLRTLWSTWTLSLILSSVFCEMKFCGYPISTAYLTYFCVMYCTNYILLYASVLYSHIL